MNYIHKVSNSRLYTCAYSSAGSIPNSFHSQSDDDAGNNKDCIFLYLHLFFLHLRYIDIRAFAIYIAGDERAYVYRGNGFSYAFIIHIAGENKKPSANYTVIIEKRKHFYYNKTTRDKKNFHIFAAPNGNDTPLCRRKGLTVTNKAA